MHATSQIILLLSHQMEQKQLVIQAVAEDETLSFLFLLFTFKLSIEFSTMLC